MTNDKDSGQYICGECFFVWISSQDEQTCPICECDEIDRVPKASNIDY